MPVAYKVVAYRDLRMWSLSDVHSLEYDVGRTTVAPPGSGLLCFRTLRDAKDFCLSTPAGGARRIVRVSGCGRVRLPRERAAVGRRLSANELRDRWTCKLPRHFDSPWPYGTVAFEAITVLSVVR